MLLFLFFEDIRVSNIRSVVAVIINNSAPTHAVLESVKLELKTKGREEGYSFRLVKKSKRSGFSDDSHACKATARTLSKRPWLLSVHGMLIRRIPLFFASLRRYFLFIKMQTFGTGTFFTSQLFSSCTAGLLLFFWSIVFYSSRGIQTVWAICKENGRPYNFQLISLFT